MKEANKLSSLRQFLGVDMINVTRITVQVYLFAGLAVFINDAHMVGNVGPGTYFGYGFFGITLLESRKAFMRRKTLFGACDSQDNLNVHPPTWCFASLFLLSAKVYFALLNANPVFLSPSHEIASHCDYSHLPPSLSLPLVLYSLPTLNQTKWDDPQERKNKKAKIGKTQKVKIQG